MNWARTELGLYLPAGQGQSYVGEINGSPLPPGLDGPAPVGVSLFTGAGGMDLGFTSAGFHVAVASDNDPPSAATYLCNMARYGQVRIEGIVDGDLDQFDRYLQKNRTRKVEGSVLAMTEYVGSGWISNYPEVRGCEIYYFGDVRNLTGERILTDLCMEQGEVSVVFGGPPCQGFSLAGKRDVIDPRNSLVFDFARLVTEIKPKTMVMENVPGVISMVTPEGIPVVDALCRILEDGGFGVYDALKKTLVETSGAGAALQGKKRGTEIPRDDEPTDQLSMLEVADAS